MEAEEKLKRLYLLLKGMKKVAIAFSGGVDSSFLLKVALDTLGNQNVLAITISSPLHLKDEIQEAENIAKNLNVNLEIIELNELEHENIKENNPDRCYWCKLVRFSKLKETTRAKNYKWLLEGSNYDDLSDYRPGLKALKELGIRSPLIEVGFTKEEIRELARYKGLQNWNKTSSACLATRIPFGTKLTIEVLTRVGKAEKALKEFGLPFFRIREHGDVVRIEVHPESFLFVLNKRKEISKVLKEVGYKYITLDLEGYRPSGLSFYNQNGSTFSAVSPCGGSLKGFE